MSDPRVDGLAHLLVNYCVAVQPGDWVVLRSDLAARPLAERVYAHILAAGGNPTVLWNDETLDESFYAAANDDQLRWNSPVEALLAERVDARIVIRAPENTRSLTGIDPARQRLHGVA